MSKVKQLFIRNIKNIEYVEMEADATINYIAGNNGAGKTSTVEAIFQAISLKEFAKADDAWKLIKKGEDNWEIKLVLDYKWDEVTVVRSFDMEKGTTVKITTQSGVKIDQTLLNSWLGDFTIDPLAFTRMKPLEQINVLKEVANINTDEVDQAIQEAFDERTHKSRLERELRAIVDKHSDVEEVATTKSLADLTEKKQALMDANGSIERARDLVQRATNAMTAYDAEIAQLKARIAELENNKVVAQKTIEENTTKAQEELFDMSEVDAEIAGVEEHNAKAYKWEQHQARIQQHAQAKADAEWLDAKVEDLRAQKMDMFVKAWLPIDWLGFDSEWAILINGIPFHQLSTSEQIKISTELATHARPELRVLYIKDGSLLDDTSMEVIAKISEERDYQIFVELVGENQTRETTITLRSWKAL